MCNWHIPIIIILYKFPVILPSPQDFVDDKSTSVQVMACCRQATSHYLSQCWPIHGVTRPQRMSSVMDVTQYICCILWVVGRSACRWHGTKDIPGHLQPTRWPTVVIQSAIFNIEHHKLLWCQLCSHWWHQRLSLWQLVVPPKLSSWQLSVFRV